MARITTDNAPKAAPIPWMSPQMETSFLQSVVLPYIVSISSRTNGRVRDKRELHTLFCEASESKPTQGQFFNWLDKLGIGIETVSVITGLPAPRQPRNAYGFQPSHREYDNHGPEADPILDGRDAYEPTDVGGQPLDETDEPTPSPYTAEQLGDDGEDGASPAPSGGGIGPFPTARGDVRFMSREAAARFQFRQALQAGNHPPPIASSWAPPPQ